MVNLLIDAGNTSIKVAVSGGDFISEEIRCDQGTIIEAVNSCIGRYGDIDVAAVSDVRGMDEDIYNFLEGCSRVLVRVKGDMKLPLNVKYSTPQTLGPDRVCAAVGAQALFPHQNCVIVDFGTAITFDFLTKDGDYLGGNISLGLATRFKALNHFTGKLPLLEKVDEVESVGSSTKGAMESGVILGTIFEIEGYINAYPQYNFIFTGGDAIFFAEKLKSPIFAVCNLVLMGLSQIAKIYAV